MSRTIPAARIAELVLEALERTAMVLAEPVDEDAASALAPSAHFARIRHFGAAEGVLQLEASDGFVRELCSSAVGGEPDEVDLALDGADALREFANIIGGSIILELGGDERVINLGLPDTLDPGNAAANVGVAGAAICHFDSMGERFTVRWWSRPESVNA